jgi:hypothetical protein
MGGEGTRGIGDGGREPAGDEDATEPSSDEPDGRP